jgi:hypothetical protein
MNAWDVNHLEGTATGPSIVVADHEVAADWSDEDGVTVALDGDMLTADQTRDLVAALAQMTAFPAPR